MITSDIYSDGTKILDENRKGIYMEKKNETRKIQRSYTLRERFDYWFDNRVSKGSLGFIHFLIVACVVCAVLIAGLIILFGFNEEGEVASVFWDSFATVINAWMPSFEDGSPGYLVMMSIIAILGVLFTSVLIGIVTSAIEEKIDNLKRGNSLVLETDHIVLLGFTPGECTLLNQLILASDGKPGCIVVAEDLEREEMEQSILENLDVPKNFRIVCRTVDITDPASIEKCSVETCRTVIVNPTDDLKTIKAVLAVSALLEEKGVPEIRVNAIVSRNEYRFPPSLVETNNITTLQSNDILAKLIAHSCTQNGLSKTFRELFNFEGSEFFLVSMAGIEGKTFEELMVRMDNATPIGIMREGTISLNPPGECLLLESDKILIFAENPDTAKLLSSQETTLFDQELNIVDDETETDTVIFGHNETLPVILHELPENISHVHLVGQQTSEEEREELENVAAERNLELKYITENIQSETALLKIAKIAEHIVILNNHDLDSDEADMETIFLLLNLRDIRKRYNLSFNITVEMQSERNQKLVGSGDNTDFLVSSSMSSLFLAQLAESPELIGAFREILSNKGNEVYLKNAGLLNLTGKHTIRELRQILLKQRYILLGYLDSQKNSSFNLPLQEELDLISTDSLIVLGEN